MDCQPCLELACGLHIVELRELFAFDMSRAYVSSLAREPNFNYGQEI